MSLLTELRPWKDKRPVPPIRREDCLAVRKSRQSTYPACMPILVPITVVQGLLQRARIIGRGLVLLGYSLQDTIHKVLLGASVDNGIESFEVREFSC